MNKFDQFIQSKVFTENPDEAQVGNMPRSHGDDSQNITFYIDGEGEIIYGRGITHSQLTGEYATTARNEFMAGRVFSHLTVEDLEEMAEDERLYLDQSMIEDIEAEDRYSVLSFWRDWEDMLGEKEYAAIERLIKEFRLDKEKLWMDAIDGDAIRWEDFLEIKEDWDEERRQEQEDEDEEAQYQLDLKKAEREDRRNELMKIQHLDPRAKKELRQMKIDDDIEYRKRMSTESVNRFDAMMRNIMGDTKEEPPFQI